MADLGGGTVARGVLDVYPSPRPHPRITLRLSRVERLISVCPPRADAVRILQALGFAVDDSGADLQVIVPSFRRDIFQEDDLVEEIIRIWGYDKIPLMRDRGGQLMPVVRPAGLRLRRAVSAQLAAAGLYECISYAFVDPDQLDRMGWTKASDLIALHNPLSRERSVLRPSLLPGLLEALATNANHQIADARIFEVGHVFSPRREGDVDRPAHEELWVGLALTGLRQPRAWHASRERVDIFDAKGMAELVLSAAAVRGWDTSPFPNSEHPHYFEPGRGARLVVGDQDVGVFGELALPVREAFRLVAPVFVAELSLSTLLTLPPWVPAYQALPRYPAVQRDLALVVPDHVTAGEIEAAIRRMHLPLLTRVVLFDVYAGDQIGSGRRSLAWSLTFQAPDRTLRDSEVNDLHGRIVKELAERFNADIRGG